MKKILLLAITIFSINSVFAQSQRLVFVEEFTQASCPPCETTTPALNALMGANLEKVVQLRYQTSWPGVDPMNADNPGEVRDRVDYYGVTGVPNLFYDGTQTNIPSNQTAVNNAYSQESPVAMTLTHTLADDLSTMNVTVTVTNEGTETYNVGTNRLRVALMEEEITWSSPPGSTSITVFDAVMKTFITGTDGMEIPEIAAGETWTQTWEDIAITPRIYTFRELGVVAFIQNDSNRRIAQSALSEPLEIGDYPNASVANATSVPDDLCDYSFVGSALITNSGDLDLTGYSVDMYVNGVLEQTKSSEEMLAVGSAAVVTFDELTLPTGNSVFGYILALDEGDISTANNRTNALNIGKVSGNIVESLNLGYENEPVNPFVAVAGAIINVPFTDLNFAVVSGAVFGSNLSLGGFGESENSLSVNLWSWNPGPSLAAEGYMVIADQYTVPESGVKLSFDYAYRPYLGSNDRLVVEVSSDCGVSFTELFNQAGTNLQTTPQLNGARFLPNSNQWRAVEADLSDFVGETILLRFRVVSAWGDMMYLDNIALEVITDVNELSDNESLNVYPNPASTSVNVELTTTNATNVQLKVIDMLGRTVQNQNLGTVSGTLNHALDVSSLANGSYLILMNVDGRDVVKRMSVAH